MRGRGEISATFSRHHVQQHYRSLAPGYANRANKVCNHFYELLASRWLGGAPRILEIGPGGHSVLHGAPAPFRTACDLSGPMLCSGEVCPNPVIGDAQELPYAGSQFDAVVCVNLLEHVPAPERAVREVARVLRHGGRFLAVTPAGDAETMLNLLERLHLKLPEGPHRFLTLTALEDLIGPVLDITEHRRFLAFPAGPRWLVHAVDAVAGSHGLFQYLLATKR